MRGGRVLLAAARGPSPLERLLACTRVALGLLADALRVSGDPQDIPVLTLGNHYISCRDVTAAAGEGRIEWLTASKNPGVAIKRMPNFMPG